MADVSKINGYDIKDKTARESIVTTNANVTKNTNAITLLQSDVNDLKNNVNHELNVVYNEETQDLTFSIANK